MIKNSTLSKLFLAQLIALGINLFAASASQAATVRFANQGDVLSPDPHSLNEAVQLAFLNNVFEALVTRGKDLKITASLASDWRLKSPTVWQFDLRKGVKFHNGTALRRSRFD
jgi:peptide/nickel transport system substrate-binding protein